MYVLGITLQEPGRDTFIFKVIIATWKYSKAFASYTTNASKSQAFNSAKIC